MIRQSILLCFLACLSAPLSAAVVVTSEGEGDVITQYFKKGEYLLTRNELPSMGVDREGNCWFVQHRRVVSDPCEQMLASVKGVRERAMASLSGEERAMMERAMQMQHAAPPAVIRKAAARRIAGYITECHLVGDDREVCISLKLLSEIKEEMGESPFLEVFRRFGESAGNMGGDTPKTKALAELAERGFPMLDLQKVVATTGLNPEMLNLLPEAQRARIMQQMGAGADGEKMRGTRVIEVNREGEMPDLDLSRYPRVGFDRFLQQSMERAGGMMR
jgi:hypothetical protein